MLVVLVSKDGASWLRDCLRALSTQTYPRLGVIAVDNGSTDGSLELLNRSLGPERVLSKPENPGLPAAVQAALAIPAAREADYFLVLHDDVALDAEAIRRMVEVAERIEGVGIVGPKVVDWDDPTILREVGLSTDRFGYPYSPLEKDEIDHGQYDRVREVLFVSSAAMLVSRAALERAGPPDERLSSSYEDLDFCWRARIAGFRVVMTPLARARHRGATAGGERRVPKSRSRTRYEAERASLAALLKNYSLVTLLWVLPLYVVQTLAKAVLWAISRRFDDVWQVFAAWGWNFLHLPGTIRRRVRAQSVRAVPDRSVRRYMAPATMRLRRWGETGSKLILGRGAVDRAGVDLEHLEEMEDIGEPTPFGRRAMSFARVHPIATGLLLLLVVGILAIRHLFGGAPLEGGALAAPPGSASAYFRELLSSARTTALGGAQPASPSLGFLGVLSVVLLGSTWIAIKALLIVLPPVAGWVFYRTLFRETGHRGPAVVGASCYALSSTLLWAFSEGRIPALVMLAVLPFFAGRVALAYQGRGLHPLRFVAATGIVLAVGVAFFPGTALAAVLLLLPWLIAPNRPQEPARRGSGIRAAGLVLGGIAAAGVLVLPQAIDLAAGGGHGLASVVGRPSFAALARLAPGGGPGSWSVAWFLPAAALLSFTLVQGPARPASRYLLTAVAAVFLAWASAAGYLPRPLTNTAAYLAVAAFAYSALVVLGLSSVLPRMGEFAFGYRQVAVVAVIALLGGGIALQAVEAARGDWAVGTDRLPAAWSLVGDSGPNAGFRVLFLGGLNGDPLVPPGGDPATTVKVGGTSIRYAVTGPTGSTALDTGRDERGPGYAAVEQVIASIAAGTTDHVGALLAPFGIRYVVALPGDLPAPIERGLARQVDVDRLPALGLLIYRDVAAWNEAGVTQQPELVKGSLPGPASANGLPAFEGSKLHPENGGFSGPSPGSGAAFVADQYASGWRVAGSEAAPERVFGWAIRLPATSSGSVKVLQPSQMVRRIEILLLALAWALALWVTRRATRS